MAFDRAAFDELGYVRLQHVFSDDVAAGLRDIAWSELACVHGVREHDRSTWTVVEPRHWKRTRTAAARLMVARPVSDALDELLGPNAWRIPDHWALLVTFPTPGEWRIPHHLWHIDGPASLETTTASEVKLFAFFGSVSPHGGGTLIVPRSHHMLARLVASQPSLGSAEPKQLWARFMAHAPWLKALASASDTSPDRAARFMAQDGDVEGLPARVVELTGEPGDVVLCHPMLFHCVAPNTADRPRFMRTTMIKRLPA
ncbi:MAG: phytanoyl-CoA dioxygenase family protein [Chloroflexi bacterium]|nr:phytanoyl-CoA dioxygenase family protein [Chloroflexota bacterium]